MGLCCCNSKTTTGEVLLGYGVHEIDINTDGEPCRVYFSIKDPSDGCCVCHGDVNKIGITIGASGFILYADIKTNCCLVDWRCESKPSCCSKKDN
jgi:hypothetical protein